MKVRRKGYESKLRILLHVVLNIKKDDFKDDNELENNFTPLKQK